MKKLLSVLAVLPVFTVSAYAAERTDNDFYKKLYFSLGTVFSDIKTEGLVTRTDATYIYSDSGSLSANIKAYTQPLNASDRAVRYVSDNPAVTVDEYGNVTADGTDTAANITITCGDITLTHPVYVTKKPRRVRLSQTELTLYADRPEPVTLSLSCEPAEVLLGDIRWYSGDESIAYIDSSGCVIPNGIGTTSVYASAHGGELTAKCTVYVGLYDVSIRSVFITNAVDKIRAGSEYTLSAYIYPDTVKDKTVHWITSDSNVIAVDGNGNIRGVAPGSAVITAEAANGVKDSFEIEVVSDSGNFKNKVISRSVSERLAELSTKPQFVKYAYSLEDMADYQMQTDPVNFSENRRAERAELLAAIDPSSFASGYGKYQFADLSQSNNIDTETLNRYLSGKGVLEGKGQIFKEAAERYQLSELYLVTHACLESGDGFSQLASGVRVNDTVVYNMFGIGAYDANAVKYGSEYAYRMGWTTVDAAIDGGARWISENYINNTGFRQNTLYKMRWNPDDPGQHQYASDINWAQAQAKIIKTMFDAFPDAELHYEIPLYKGEKEFALK